LEEYVVEDLRRHVLGSGHRKLPKIIEQKTTTKIDKFQANNIVLSIRNVFPFSGCNHYVLAFEIWMDDAVAVDKSQSFSYLYYDIFKLFLIWFHSV